MTERCCEKLLHSASPSPVSKASDMSMMCVASASEKRKGIARLHDSTMRDAFDAYSRARVDVDGHLVVYDPDGETSYDEWMKERLARAKQTIPNGFYGRPLQLECPHPNACLTCPDFLTDVTFLDGHREQRGRTRKLIATAETNGQFRLVEMNRKVEANLDSIITTLETLEVPDAR